MVDVARGYRRSTGHRRAGGSAGAGADLTQIAQSLFSFLDPNNVAPPRKKLPNVESQRIITVMDEVMKKVQLVSIVPALCEDVSVVEGIMPATAVAEIQQHAQLLERFEAARAEAAEAPNSAGLAQARADAADAVRNSVRNLTRTLQNHPAALAEARARLDARNVAMGAFLERFEELKTLMFERLLTTVEEEKQRQDYLRQVIAKEQRSSTEVEKLEGQLGEARRERNKEVSKRNEVIRRLKDELHDIKTQTAETNKKVEADCRTRMEACSDVFAATETQLKDTIEKLKQKLGEETKAHRETELALRKRKFKIETEVENWINKYDADMTEKQDELEELQGVYHEELEQLAELEKQYNKLKDEYERILEERRIESEKKDAAEREMRILVNSATLIQAIWRGFKARRALKNKGRSKSSEKKKK